MLPKQTTKLNYIFKDAHIIRETTKKVITVKVTAIVTSRWKGAGSGGNSEVDDVSDCNIFYFSYWVFSSKLFIMLFNDTLCPFRYECNVSQF